MSAIIVATSAGWISIEGIAVKGMGNGLSRQVLGCLLWISLFFGSLAAAQTGGVGHWKLDEGTGSTTADTSSSGYTGTLVNAPVWSTGRIGSALGFNTNRYVTVGAGANLANLYASGMTVSVWISPASGGTGNGGRIVDKSNGGAGWSLKMNGSSAVQFAASEFATTDAQRDSSSSIVLNTWQHVAATWTGSATGTTIHLYVNGVLSDGTATNGAGALRDDSGTPLAIGNRPLDAARAFDGLIDDVRVYNRVLSATEIQALADSAVPSAPGSVSATAASSTQINLGWTASTDNVAVTNYLIERCTGASCTTFSQVATVTGTSYNNTGLTPSTTYRYRVRATDANTNLSAYSSIVSATTTSGGTDSTAPTAPTGLTATAVSSSLVSLTWTASTDNVAVTGYLVERCQGAGCSVFTQIGNPTTTSYNENERTASTVYRYRVRARDAVPNYSGYSSIATATTPASSDTQAPTAPASISATAISGTQVNVSWAAASDNVSVAGYRLERCSGTGCATFAQIATPVGTSYSDTDCTGGTSYSYRVRAVDVVPNVGPYSATASATTPAGQTITYFHNDSSGTPILATNASGAVIWKENYRPYGDKLNNQPASSGNKLGFAGKPYDGTSGLSYMGARYYDPMLGRFMGPDPAGFDPESFQSFNRYAYANNNPYKFVDEDGHSPIDVAFLAYDLGKLSVALYTGVGVSAAVMDVAWSTVGVFSPIPGTGQAIKAVRAVEHGVELAKVADHASDALRAADSVQDTAKTAKPLSDQAADLIPLNAGRNRVTLRSPSQQMEVDLAGKSHGGVPTPHTKVSPLNPRAPNQPAYNTKNSPVEPATQQDIRTVRRYLERQD